MNKYIQERREGFLLVAHRNCTGYDGMVLCIMIRFDAQRSIYKLALEWMCFGLDFYGDTLQETYTYQFDSLENLLKYLRSKYAIKPTDIPMKYQFDGSRFPNPLKDESKKPLFESVWHRFQDDFKKGVFLDSSLKLV